MDNDDKKRLYLYKHILQFEFSPIWRYKSSPHTQLKIKHCDAPPSPASIARAIDNKNVWLMKEIEEYDVKYVTYFAF
jgi:hypothetical protein